MTNSKRSFQIGRIKMACGMLMQVTNSATSDLPKKEEAKMLKDLGEEVQC